jgi:hypothetical protein
VLLRVEVKLDVDDISHHSLASRPNANRRNHLLEHRPKVVAHQVEDALAEFGRDKARPTADIATHGSFSTAIAAPAATRAARIF